MRDDMAMTRAKLAAGGEPNWTACVNVVRGLNAEGQNRLEEAATSFSEDRAAMAALHALKERIECTMYFPVDCTECGQWDGLQRRCDCGNRRVSWKWDGAVAWIPEVY